MIINKLRGIKSHFLKKAHPLVRVNSFSADNSINESKNVVPYVCYQTWETRYFRMGFAKGLMEFHNDNKEIKFILYDRQKRDSYMNSKE